MNSYLRPEDDGLLLRPSGQWAKAKLDYLQRYIDVFETAMRSKWQVRHYVDLFAGPGKCLVRGGRGVFLGSPLLALTTRYPFTHYIFADMDQRNTEALQKRCAASPLSTRVTILTGDSNKLVDGVVAQINQAGPSLNLAFLDPEGIGDLEWATVAKLASVRRMDLIINYPKLALSRNMPAAFKRDEPSPIDDFFGGREWRDVYREHVEERGRRGLWRRLLNLYKEKLQMLDYKVRGEEDTGDEILVRSTEKQLPLYYLVFASKDPLGEDFWQKITQRDVTGQKRLKGF